jgi:hypothetical protein
VISAPREVFRLRRLALAGDGTQRTSRAHSSIPSPNPDKLTTDAPDEVMKPNTDNDITDILPVSDQGVIESPTADNNTLNRAIRFLDEPYDIEQTLETRGNLEPEEDVDKIEVQDEI